MINRLTTLHKFMSLLWGLLMLAFSLYCVHGFIVGEKIKFDILDMLPSSHSESLQEVRRLLEDSNIIQKVVILVGHKDPEIAKTETQKLKNAIAQARLPLSEHPIQSISENYKKLFTELFPYRSYLLTPEDRHHIATDSEDQLVARAIAEIMAPFSAVNIKNDPFNLFTHYVQLNSPNSPFQIDDNNNLFVTDNRKTWVIYLGTINASAFSLEVQKDFINKLTPILKEMSKVPNLEILKTGSIFYAAAGAQQAQDEISLIGSLSLAGIILLLVGIFRNLRSLFFAFSVILTSIIVGLTVCLVLFDNIHILALVFGCSLVGITVDYALHYTCASYQTFASPFDIFKKLMPALPLSALTSATGFALLLLVPFPGIQQMAVLSSVGLISALLTVFLWGPYFSLCQTKPISSLGQRCQKYLALMANYSHSPTLKIFCVIVSGIIFVLGCFQLSFDDNLQNLQSLNPALKQQENKINSLMANESSPNFIAVKGSSLQDVLEKQEKLFPQLDAFGISYRALATLVPSHTRQKSNQELVKNHLYTFNILTKLTQILGQKTGSQINDFAPPVPPLNISLNDLPIGLKELAYTIGSEEIIGRIMLSHLPDEAALKNLLHHQPDARYINPAQEYSHLFTLYRHFVMTLIGLILGGIAMILAIGVNLRAACQIIAPLMVALLGSIGLLEILAPLNLFHVMGLLLSLCIGIDYALFLYWGQRQSTVKKNNLLLLCNGLSSITTVLSFGLLGFSQTRAVHSFGLSVFIGITAYFIGTTIFLGSKEKINE
ncbi:MAG: MMPL family transporter [Candidatus Paracaedibacteraceae bacterium]|nr:MMPL family transporter [Candidatus Paracaedibacteraceae bacterium]